MRVLRAFGGALLWIVASVVCLVALILCVTVVLLPLGIPLFKLGRRLFGQAILLFMPPGALHPVKTSSKVAKSKTRNVVDGVSDRVADLPRPNTQKAGKQLKKRWRNVANA